MNKTKDVIIVIIMNGINTMNQDTILNPFLHKKFNSIVNIIITINLIKAKLYKFLNISIIMCVSVNTIYNIAGGQIFFNNICIYLINILNIFTSRKYII